MECKRRGTVCVAVSRGIPCLGPVTQAGCGAICPAFDRECFGCYGPKEQPNLYSLDKHYEGTGIDDRHLLRLARSFNGYAPEFREVSNTLQQAIDRNGGPALAAVTLQEGGIAPSPDG
jgi:hypothetical protein